MLESSPAPWGYPPPTLPPQPPNDSSSLLYNLVIPALVTKAGAGRQRRIQTIPTCTPHRAERCRRYCSQDGRCWPMSRGGLYHFPVALYFNTGKSSRAPTAPALPLPLAATSALPAARQPGNQTVSNLSFGPGERLELSTRGLAHQRHVSRPYRTHTHT